MCNGKLYSCSGHRVFPSLPERALSDSLRVSMITMLRHPWNRLQSDYHYILSKPETQHLSPEINITHLLLNVSSLYEYIKYPGISNCAVKMLNGIQCGDSFIEITDKHLEISKQVLSSFLWFGITEYFKTSVCQFSWMYGSNPTNIDFQKHRSGNYTFKLMEEVLNETEMNDFVFHEIFDIELYKFGLEIFESRQQVTTCPYID